MEKRKREYYHALTKCRRRLEAASRAYCPWDFGYLFDMIMIIFKHWEEYYKFGYNTDGEERKDSGIPGTENIPTREEIARTLYEKLSKVDDIDTIDKQKAIEDFADYFAKWVLYMWD